MDPAGLLRDEEPSRAPGPREFITELRVSAAASSAMLVDYIKLALGRPVVSGPAGAMQVAAELSVDLTARVKFAADGDRQTGVIDVAVYAGDARPRRLVNCDGGSTAFLPEQLAQRIKAGLTIVADCSGEGRRAHAEGDCLRLRGRPGRVGRRESRFLAADTPAVPHMSRRWLLAATMCFGAVRIGGNGARPDPTSGRHASSIVMPPVSSIRSPRSSAEPSTSKTC